MASTPVPDHYAILNLTLDMYPSAEQIRTAYIEQVRKVHNAYEILSDATQRTNYNGYIITEAYRRGMPGEFLNVAHQVDFVKAIERSALGPPFIAQFLDLAAYNGSRKYHDRSFQDGVDARHRVVGRGFFVWRGQALQQVEVQREIADAQRRWEEIRVNFLSGVVARLRLHDLLPDHPVMQGAFHIVATLGYLHESMRVTQLATVGQWAQLHDVILGAIDAHRKTLDAMVPVLQRLMTLAAGIDYLRDGDPGRHSILNWVSGAMRNWPEP